MTKDYSFSIVETPIGGIMVIASEIGVKRICISGGKPPTQTKLQNNPPAELFAQQAASEICDYFSKKRKTFTLPLDWSAVTSLFQKKVLEAALNIPFGQVKTYGEIAESLGNRNAGRAVGAALGRNPMPILIPCHRVVASNGHLTGFSAPNGIHSKQWLLELEGHHIDHQKLG